MRTFLMACFLFLALSSLKGRAKIEFINETYEFGRIARGSRAVAEFFFVNTGNEPLILNYVKSSCGCLTPDWDRDPVMPGDTGLVKGKYNSNRIGIFNKTMRVSSNAVNEEMTVLYIRGEVIDLPTTVIWSPANKSDAKLRYVKGRHGDSLIVDFGKVDFGEMKEASFRFTVTGELEFCLFCRSGGAIGSYPVLLMSDQRDDLYDADRFVDYYVEENGGVFYIPALDPLYSDGRFQSGDIGYLRIVLVNNVGDEPNYRKVKRVPANLPDQTYLVIKADMELDHSRTPAFVISRAGGKAISRFREGKCVNR